VENPAAECVKSVTTQEIEALFHRVDAEDLLKKPTRLPDRSCVDVIALKQIGQHHDKQMYLMAVEGAVMLATTRLLFTTTMFGLGARGVESMNF